MPSVFYRGDTRGPEEIKLDGCTLWGDALGVVTRAGGMKEWLTVNVLTGFSGKTKQDLVRWAVTAKDRARPTISTSMDVGCGGYDGGYIYKIEFDTLKEVEISSLDCELTNGTLGVLHVSTHTFLESKVKGIDLRIDSKEVIFFNQIPPAAITEYKAKDMKEFESMSKIAAKRKALW